jgi:hypothetical protein
VKNLTRESEVDGVRSQAVRKHFGTYRMKVREERGKEWNNHVTHMWHKVELLE